MRVNYDPESDGATIHLTQAVPFGGVARSIMCDTDLTDASIILDLDADERLIAIEVLGASKVLPREVLGEHGA